MRFPYDPPTCDRSHLVGNFRQDFILGIEMTDSRKIHTGTYIFGNQKENTSFGGIFGTINLPNYSSEISLFINNSCENKTEIIDDAKVYQFHINELESIFNAIGRLINDLRKLEALSRKDLLRDEAYHRD